MLRLLRSALAGLLAAVLIQAPVMAAPAPATAPPLGVILQAQRANIGNDAAASGSTIFDGDLLQTDRDGLLHVRFGLSQAYLMPGSAAVVHRSADGFAANLTRGGVLLSSAQGQKFHVVADGATIEPGTPKPTMAQVTWVSPKELILTSRKGALEVSMGSEVKSVPEGTSYRMLIDPAAANAKPVPSSGPGPQGAQVSGSNTFVLVLITTTAALIALFALLSIESPPIL